MLSPQPLPASSGRKSLKISPPSAALLPPAGCVSARLFYHELMSVLKEGGGKHTAPPVREGECAALRLPAWKLERTYGHMVSVDPRRRFRARHSQVSLEGQMLWREFFYACGWGTPNFDKMARYGAAPGVAAPSSALPWVVSGGCASGGRSCECAIPEQTPNPPRRSGTRS